MLIRHCCCKYWSNILGTQKPAQHVLLIGVNWVRAPSSGEMVQGRHSGWRHHQTPFTVPSESTISGILWFYKFGLPKKLTDPGWYLYTSYQLLKLFWYKLASFVFVCMRIHACDIYWCVLKTRRTRKKLQLCVCVCCVVCVRKAIPCQMIFWGTISDIPPLTGLLHPGRDTISLIQATLVAFLSVTKVSKLRRWYRWPC